MNNMRDQIFLAVSNSSSSKSFDKVSAFKNKSSETREQSRSGTKKINATSDESGESMDDATKMILERLERDSRERESRYHEDAKERESRVSELTKETRQDNKDREERL